ncbi:NifB/NifX family molybdenum-iron cluster-binding protein [Emergencia sp. 1XD21-10]|uniref:NifB/NifX family molybdenum-iron cluster-binding protein n=1 Tax=Emergencia sp. 1XD21-10 TaxID=2304569 RepID=UPI00137AEA5F|nr:NifB/NifX family molybdenum-iron cluster-binding protein [Emergencia sp. 1XD21-10]NCF00224.1 DUF134 domain-containing protein [Emergencia sp. 1XD21-10]
MPRPRKNRMVNTMPTSEGFIPAGYEPECCSSLSCVTMTVDEYETIRLIDYLGMTQEECAASMQVSRPTVTNIYESARYKLADALIHEKPLLISGGNYDICHKNKKTATITKETTTMKIAITYENGEIYQHFGHCENFKIYQVEDGKILSSSIENAAGSGHGALAGFLKNLGVDVLICGGIGGGAQNALAQAGIRLYGGVSGSADEAVQALVDGTLVYNANVQCSHHGEGHTCGGGNSCHH